MLRLPQRDLRCYECALRLSCCVNAGDNAIALVGFMGAGKSAVGRELSRRTGIPRYETDEMIRHNFGLSIPEIFAQLIEIAFRNAETELLRNLSSAQIIAIGSGIVILE